MDKVNVKIPHTNRIQTMKKYHENMRETLMLYNLGVTSKQVDEMQKLCTYVLYELRRIENMKG